jgi:DNA polymerase elongation subunit (family B)
MKPTAVFDIECYKNYFLVSFLDVATGKVKSFEQREGVTLDVMGIKKILKVYKLVGFNSAKYDILMLSAALKGGLDLKVVSDSIIKFRLMPWEFEDKYGLKLSPVDMIDLIEVAPDIGSLKTYGARLHSRTLWDLPYDIETILTNEQMDVVKEYCSNDLQTTLDLYNYLMPQIKLREDMSRTYGTDLRSKSDAQIAEAVIKRLLKEKYGIWAKRPQLDSDYSFKYKAPKYLKGKLDGLVDAIEGLTFCLDDNGSVVMPEFLKNKIIKIGDGEYRMGIGGLHSSESCVSITPTENEFLLDRDVASYYPSIIINEGYYPEHLGREFLIIYRDIYNERLKAKHSGDKTRADVMKITLNGTFGKLGSKWSIFYSPDMLIQVTITGQLCLLWLIDALNKIGIRTVSANTDGIVLFADKSKYSEMLRIVAKWEKLTNLVTEETPYKSIHNRDVNSYINVKVDGKVKTKGAYALDGLAKNPHGDIATIAAIEYLTNKTPVEATIRSCKDIRKFLFVRKVKGGALKGETFLGKVVRWYYSTEESTPINYAKNGNKVSESDKGRPLMTLPDTFPDDVHHQMYVDMSNKILKLIGEIK